MARTLTRLGGWPFRVCARIRRQTFLAFSLTDAIATSLSSIGSLVVRSSATAAASLARGRNQAWPTRMSARVVMGTLRARAISCEPRRSS